MLYSVHLLFKKITTNAFEGGNSLEVTSFIANGIII